MSATPTGFNASKAATLGLCAEISMHRGERRIELALEVAPGETLALLGPNGAGKTSCLMAIAGLIPGTQGRLSFRGRSLQRLPPGDRSVGMVFQDLRLLPHLSPLDNVAYGLRAAGRGRRAARIAAAPWLERVGLPQGRWHVPPGELSGGEAQRVALARALAVEPDILLMDEPLAAVDASGRLELRRELREHLSGFAGAAIVVVHQLTDALALTDRIAVLEGGRVVRCGTAAELVARPGTAYIADLVGLNGHPGTAADGVVDLGGLQLTVVTRLEGDVLVTIHPRAVSLFPVRPEGSPRNVWRAEVGGLEPGLDRIRVLLQGPLPVVAEVTPSAVQQLGLAPGVEVWAAVKATEIQVAPR